MSGFRHATVDDRQINLFAWRLRPSVPTQLDLFVARASEQIERRA
jgi:hypothetical protein